MAYRFRKLRGIPREQVRIVTLHLGNGCSACAIENGDSVDTSMGFTPLEDRAYLAAMGGAEAVVFTGGIGENSPAIRARVAAGLEWIGLEIDAQRNAVVVDGRTGEIGRAGSRLAAWVIPTNEELLIARDTVRVVEDAPRRL